MSCCPTTTTAVVSDYKPLSVPVYEAGDYTATTAIIYVPDIFGFSPQAKQVCDILGARTGLRVVAIDFFNNQPWKLENFPPPAGMDLMAWIRSYDFETVTKPIVLDVIKKLKFQGVTTFHAVGNCWGARVALNLQQQSIVDRVAGFHPSFITENEKDTDIKAPQCMLMSKDEEPLLAVKAAIEASPFAAQSVWEVFPNMHHGWMAARANLNDEENRKELERGLDIAVNFFTQ